MGRNSSEMIRGLVFAGAFGLITCFVGASNSPNRLMGVESRDPGEPLYLFYLLS